MTLAQNSMEQGQNVINPALLKPEVQNWIRQTEYTLEEIAFAPLPFEGISRQELLQQVEGYRKTTEKLPDWSSAANLLFPVKLSLEQCSSQGSAVYKALLARQLCPKKEKNHIADLTGGFGVDSYYLAQSDARVHHFELDSALSQLVAHNMTQLNAEVVCHHADGLVGIQGLDEDLDLIYLDPARRDAQKNKVFRLEDCRPNILAHLDPLLAQSPCILLKTSPMLDLHLGLKQLKWVTEIHVLAINNEVKELLWVIQKSAVQNQCPQVFAINLQDHNLDQSFNFSDVYENDSKGKAGIKRFNQSTLVRFSWNLPENDNYSLPLAYLFEPNAALRKIGQYGALTHVFNVLRIGPNAHLFTAQDLCDFPGRHFKIIQSWPYSKRLMKQFKGKQYNITTRDFPQSVAQIRTSAQIKDGGAQYLFFTTDAQGQKWIILSEKPLQTSKND